MQPTDFSKVQRKKSKARKMKLKTGSMEFAIDEMKSDLPTTSSTNSLQENIAQEQTIYTENGSLLESQEFNIYKHTVCL